MNCITFLDFLGKKPTLLMGGNTSNKTLLGGMISIIVLRYFNSGFSIFS